MQGKNLNILHSSDHRDFAAAPATLPAPGSVLVPQFPHAQPQTE